MKTLRLLFAIAALMTAYTLVSASETSDNFAQWVPDFASSDLNKKKDSQQHWQNFCRQQGNKPDVQKEIIRVSIEQLSKDNPVDTTVWIVRQLGIVGNATAVPALAKLLPNAEVRIRDEAARALANIPGRAAETALKNNNVILSAQLAKDALTARTIKAAIPKNNTVETQMPLAIPYLPFTGISPLNAWMAGYEKLSDMEKAQSLSNLATRFMRMQVMTQQSRIVGTTLSSSANTIANTQRKAYIPLALDAAKSADETLRNAGILAVGALGGEAEVPFLLEQARVGANKELAKVALSRMSGKEIDALLLTAAKSEENAEKMAILADILNRRFNTEMRIELLAKAKADNTPNRLELLQRAEPMCSSADIPEFLKVWTLITDRGQKDQAEQCIARLSSGDANPVIQALGDNWDTPEAMSLLGRIGDARVLDKIRQGKNALHAFRTWTNAVVADDLMKIASDEQYSDEDRILVLRAYIRVISLPGTRQQDQIGIRINDVQKVNRLAEVYELAKRVDEKRLIIERVGTIRTVESLRFVLKYFDEAELQERVCWAILELAHQTNLKLTAKDEFNAALDKVLEVTTNEGYRTRANQS
jgi:hypothetical protein